MIKDTTGIIQAGASATAANNFVLDASAANGTAKLYSGNAGTPVNTVLTVDAAGGITPLAPMHTAAVTPIFSAYQSVAQTFPTVNATIKVNFQTKEFDTTNAFDNVTNMRFQPLVAGYYSVTGSAYLPSSYVMIWKNGIEHRRGTQLLPSNSGVAALVYLNGSTDYIELFINSGATGTIGAYPYTTYFQAALIARV